MIDIEQFCTALDGDSPAGQDVEYDEDFLALEEAQKGKPERQYGDTVIPAEAPDWKQVLAQATSVSGRTRDLRLACTITRALTHLHGLSGLICGVQLIERLCQEMWDSVYPLLDTSDNNDSTLRMNALGPLSARDGLLADIRACTYASARGMGTCTVRQLEIALGILTPLENGAERNPDLAEIGALVAAAQAEGSFTENLAQRAIDLTQELQSYLCDRVGIENAPDLDALIARLRPIAEYSREFVSTSVQELSLAQQDMSAHGEAVTQTETSGRGASIAAVGEIRSRQDATRMLDLVCAYFEQHEPTNPAPLLLRRARRLCAMSFVDIVRDIAPDALSSVELVAGRTESAGE